MTSIAPFNLWDRQPDEPTFWYRRFELYRDAGSERTMLGVVNAYRVQKGQKRSNYVPGSWRRIAERWHWKERAEAWDAAESERRRIEREAQDRTEREAARVARRRLIAELNDLAEKAAAIYKSAGGILAGDLAKLTAAVAKLNDDSRAEFGDIAAQQLNISGSMALTWTQMIEQAMKEPPDALGDEDLSE